MKVSIKKITTAAVVAALVFAVTSIVRIPIPATSGGYVNFGDVVIFIAAFVMGGPLAAIAAAVGSALADLAAGAAAYIIPTFIIKGLMALTFGAIARGRRFPLYALACVIGGLIMTTGYALYEWSFFGATYAIGSLPFNLMQWAGSCIIACILYPIAKRINEGLSK